MKKPIKALFVSHNPGGFNAILPVYLELKKNRDFKVLCIFEKEAKSVNRVKSIEFTDSHKINLENLRRHLKKEEFDVLVAGTSQGNTIDKKAIMMARKLKIPSIAIVDFWSNYKMRFSDPNSENLRYLPNFIFVMDDYCKREMAREGFNPQSIFVTGNPYFDDLKERMGNLKKINGKYILFFCQPFTEIEEISWGFDEIEVFEDLVETFEKLNINKKIVIKMHPRSKHLKKFDTIMKDSKLDIIIDNKTSSEKLIKNSFLVTGMNSIALMEAALAGKKVLSYQPNLNKKDPLISNKMGLTKAVYKKKQLLKIIKKLVKSKPPKISSPKLKCFEGKSTDRVIKEIYKILLI